MYKHFEHIGMGTADLDASLHFYVDLIGCTLIVRKKAANGTQVAFVDAGGAQLEIMCPADVVKAPAHRVSNSEVGLRHLTFTFDSVDDTYAKLLAAGVIGIEKPRDAINRDILARVAFVQDPDGIVIELAQR